MIRLTLASLVLSTMLIAGCATEGSSSSASSRDDCFFIRNVNSWNAIDEKHLYLDATGDQQFLVTMDFACRGIRFANAIALSDPMGRVCPNDFGRITYRDAGRRASCRIDDIESVANRDEAEAMVEARQSE